LSIKQEWEVISKRFDELDIGGKITIKGKLAEIAYPTMTSLCPLLEKVKTKGSQKTKQKRLERSTKCDPSYFEHVDKIHSMEDSCSRQKASRVKVKSHSVLPFKVLPCLDQFHPITHPYIVDIIDVKPDGQCGYRSIAALLGMGEESWPLIIMDLYKEICNGVINTQTFLVAMNVLMNLRTLYLLRGHHL